MGWIRKLILKSVIRAIQEGDDKTRKIIKDEVLGLIKENGVTVGNFTLTDSDGAFTISKQ